MAKRPKVHPQEDTLLLQRIAVEIIAAHPIHPDNPRIRLQTVMRALIGDKKTDAPWPAPNTSYFEVAQQLRLDELREGMAHDLPREDQVGIMSLIPEKTPRARKIRKAADRLQGETQFEDIERVFKENIQKQPTRPLAHYLDLQEVLRILAKHKVIFDSRGQSRRKYPEV